ncbi:MAG: cysteine desulfurase [Clostridia bacterium]|nr:cysteine desulfurase [Clostridia bacterium]
MHYLDNSATTPLCQEAITAMSNAMARFGNPSSLHALGAEALMALDNARQNISAFLGCEAKELYFTSCGSEANNTALFGAARAMKRRGKRIITTAIEHHSVLNAAKALEAEGFEVIYLKPNSEGVITAQAVADALTEDTILVSVMYVNNETGAVMPIPEIAAAIKSSGCGALFHTDCVQAFGKLPFTVKGLGADLVSVSGHKIHGPKGVGALFVKNGCRILPFIYGGGQEKGLRSGTEPTLLIEGFSAAVSALPELQGEFNRIDTLRKKCVNGLSALKGVTVNSGEGALPYIINLSVAGIRSEVMLHWLESKGIYVSSGSACAKGESSHVLQAQGVSRQSADSAVRISMSHFTAEEDIDALIDAVGQGIDKLVRRR